MPWLEEVDALLNERHDGAVFDNAVGVLKAAIESRGFHFSHSEQMSIRHKRAIRMNQTTDYIFSINTGRSGSHYLSNLFQHVPGCRSFHEPEPIGNGQAMRDYARGYHSSMERLAAQKAEQIKRVKQDCQLYFESNHCFIKGFGWFIPDHLPEDRIGIIVLKRDKVKTAKSLLRIGCSPLVPLGRDWISTPDMQDYIVRPPTTPFAYQSARFAKLVFSAGSSLARKCFRTSFEFPPWMFDYELKCLEWYVEETYAKAESFKERHPAIKYYEVDVEELNSVESVQHMLAFFGHRGGDSLDQAVGYATNLK